MPPKRRLGVDPSNIIEGDVRGKRRRDVNQTMAESSSPAPDTEATDKPSGLDTSADPQQVQVLGLRIWNAVKDAKGKE